MKTLHALQVAAIASIWQVRKAEAKRNASNCQAFASSERFGEWNDYTDKRETDRDKGAVQIDRKWAHDSSGSTPPVIHAYQKNSSVYQTTLSGSLLLSGVMQRQSERQAR